MPPNLAERMSEACKLFNAGKHAECAAEMIAMLSDYGLPRYYQIKCRILLASAQDDWYNAETHRKTADTLWTIYRHFWPPGIDSAIHRQFDELRMFLDELKEAQDSDRPDDYFDRTPFHECDVYPAENGTEYATHVADSEDEEAANLYEAEDEAEADLEESKPERNADLLGGDLTKTLHTKYVEALYKKVDFEMIGEKFDPEKDHSKIQHADDGEGKGQEMVTSGHEQPEAKDDGEAKLFNSQRKDTLAKHKTEKE